MYGKQGDIDVYAGRETLAGKSGSGSTVKESKARGAD